MGNSGSQNATTENILPNEKWAHSFPRSSYHSQPKLHFQHKVLPEKNVRLKLKCTNNGEILQSGGTISRRHVRSTSEDKTKRHREKEHEKDVSRKSAIYGVQHKLCNNVSSQQVKYFTSEPDLRYALTNEEFPEKKSKKKYRAPSPPKIFMNNDPFLSTNEDIKYLNPILPIRKARLFKTRAETRKQSSQLNENMDDVSNNNEFNLNRPNTSKRLSLPEAKLLDSKEFYKELKSATERIRNSEKESKRNDENDKLKTLDPTLINEQNLRRKLKEDLSNNGNFMSACTRGEASGKESTTPEMSPSPKSRHDIKERLQPRQLFYFGMTEKDNFTNINSNKRHQHSSASDISSDIDSDENDAFRVGIDLQLRPILPKKQLEIPRFSPSAAWRLLHLDTAENNADDTGTGPATGCESTIVSDDIPLLMEEQIEKYSRPLPPLLNAGQRSSIDKSGDSGISGDDAVPIVCYDDDDIIPKVSTNDKKSLNRISSKTERISWIPQQDLEDESSAEEDAFNKQRERNHRGPHLFSLSLPRENHLAAYLCENTNTGPYNGLQKFKKSISGVWGNFSNKKDCFEERNSNWFLSRSAPNSLTHAIHSLERHKTLDDHQSRYCSNNNKTTRVMYLPENQFNSKNNSEKLEVDNHRNNTWYSLHSKSCENITLGFEQKLPEPLQDPLPNDSSSWNIVKKPKKFTFQSTIRQIEKKRLSDKLSKEAEKKEMERLRELDAMQKVEEEFQRKRAREKANIRQQLRLFSLDESNGFQSLPPKLDLEHKYRSEPDGAFSSSDSSSSSLSICSKNGFPSDNLHNAYESNKLTAASTKELSEFRQMQTDYKDYNSNVLKHTSMKRFTNKHTTIHPQVRCNMPKVRGLKTKGNYRKEFAYGVRNVLSTDGTHSEESQNHRKKTTRSPSYHNTFLPV